MTAPSPWKDYSTLYDVVENESDWTGGLRCLLAYALHERFKLPIQALVGRPRGDMRDSTSCIVLHPL